MCRVGGGQHFSQGNMLLTSKQPPGPTRVSGGRGFPRAGKWLPGGCDKDSHGQSQHGGAREPWCLLGWEQGELLRIRPLVMAH